MIAIIYDNVFDDPVKRSRMSVILDRMPIRFLSFTAKLIDPYTHVRKT